jgi:F-box protein 42
MAANYLSAFVKDDSCLFMRLPEEIVEKILCYLLLRSDQNLGRLVCTLWNRVLLRIRNKRHETFLQSVKNGKIYWRKYANTSRVSPAPRFSHASCVLKGKLCIFGGCSSTNTVYNDLFVFCLEEQKWSKVTTSGFTPVPRECATLVSYWTKNTCIMILFGGCCQPPRSLMPSNGKFFNDVQILNFVDQHWTGMRADESYPCPRAGHSASVIGNTMVIFGGAQSEKRSDLYHSGTEYYTEVHLHCF